MQAKGIDGVEEPLDRIEDMARYSLDAVRQLQPHGPYLLIGFSLGGLVTLEMAQQLIADGEKIGLLAMLDSYPHVSRAVARDSARVWRLRQTWRRAARRLQWLGVSPPFETTVEVSPSPSAATFPRDFLSGAGTLSTPVIIPGKINFVRAAIPYRLPCRSSCGLVESGSQEFELTTVPGDHLWEL
jgi:pimeloyl-ACP methyl ester carboxylesterase